MLPHFLVIVLGLASTLALRLQTDKESKTATGPNCHQFSMGVQLNDIQVLGSWHLLVYRTASTKGSGDHYCATFTEVTHEERKSLKELIGKYVENMNWENLSLKMQVPCSEDNSNKTRVFYLEKLGSDGSYRTLQVPTATEKIDLAKLHRYPMRLKIIDGGYLVIMDCHEKFVFIMGRQLLYNKPVDEKLNKVIDIYWPKEE